MERPKKGMYRHYRGRHYRVMGICRHSETLEEMVIYKGQYTDPKFGKNPVWVRPLSMFLEEVEINGKKRKRFEFVG